MYEYCYSYLGTYERVYISNCTVQDPGLVFQTQLIAKPLYHNKASAARERNKLFFYAGIKKEKVPEILKCCY